MPTADASDADRGTTPATRPQNGLGWPCNQGWFGFRPDDMRRLGTVVGAGVLMVLVAGCGSHQQGGSVAGGGGLTTSPTTGVTAPAIPGVQVPAGAVPVPGDQVSASSLPSAFPRIVWLEKNGTVLGLYGEVGGCFTSSATATQQTDTRVIVRLVQQEPGTGSHMCPMYLRYKPMSVPLAKPLGTRTVVLQLGIVRG
jgi:hypothetical protein